MLPHTQKSSGFTIVELLIVIVVIAILAAITIVAFSGVQDRAKQSSRVATVDGWQKILLSYKVLNNEYPALANGEVFTTCLATNLPKTADFDEGVCAVIGSTATASINTEVMDKLRGAGATLPQDTFPITIANYPGFVQKMRAPTYSMTVENGTKKFGLSYTQAGRHDCARGTANTANFGSGRYFTTCITDLL